MEKFFNTAGPIKTAMHYYIPPLERVDWPEIQHLIASGKYFVLHAPRQTGKTSALLEMMAVLNAAGHYFALYANIEGAQAARGNVEQGVATICEAIAQSAKLYLKDLRLVDWLHNEGNRIPVGNRLQQLLTHWADISDRACILLLDEVDALIGDTLIALLRQIRAGYAQRPEAFPQSIVLCGVRDIRDYRMHGPDAEIVTGGSAFNIKAESLRLGNFNDNEIRRLFAQHTDATGQIFEDELFRPLWEDTRGQPWLVNALGYELTWNDREARDRKIPITLEKYQTARDRIIYSRTTHLDQLTDKLKEPRVRRVMEPILKGDDSNGQLHPDDVSYVEDLGLIEQTRSGAIQISNLIYQEVIPRELAYGSQLAITQESLWYLTPDHRLNMPKLLDAFQQFFREHADIWLQGFDYKEAGPQILMQAFLQRIVNGGGRIHREYALGRKRTDLLIEWPLNETEGLNGPKQHVVIELKLLRHGRDKTLADGLLQTSAYADQVGADEAYLIIFDRDPQRTWTDKTWQAEHEQNNRSIKVWGC